MKYHGQYCNIQIKHTHTQTPDFFTKENSTHQKGIICTTYFIKNAIVLYIKQFYHMKPKWWTNAHVANMQDLYQTTQDYFMEQVHLAKWDLMQPKSLSSFGRGMRAGPWLPHLCTEQLLVQMNCLIPASLPATLPSLPCPPELLYSFLSSDSNPPSVPSILS